MTNYSSIQATQLATHGEFVRRLALALVSREEDAEDVAQEAWLAASKNPPVETNAGAIRNWYRKVVTNAAMQHHREKSRRQVREEASARNELQPDSTRTVEQLEFHEVLVKRVLAVDEPLRTTVVLRYLEDETAGNVARRMNVPVNTVHDRLRRALQLLRNEMDESAGGERSSWALALLPNAFPSKSIAGTASSIGVIKLIGSVVTMKLAIALAVVLVSSVLWVQMVSEPEVNSHSNDITQVANNETTLKELERTDAAFTDVLFADKNAELVIESKRELVAIQTEESEARCRAFGRVVDGTNMPIKGVSVVFSAWSKWCEGEANDEAEPMEEGNSRGFKLRTNDLGVFSLDAPIPTEQRVSLELELDNFHTKHRVIYGGTYHAALPKLSKGDQDLGTFVLNHAGMVNGRVVNESGEGVAGAKVAIDLNDSDSSEPEVETSESGHYRVGNIPVGTYDIRVVAEGYLFQQAESIPILANHDQAGPNFTLRAGPTLQGTVRDKAGRPIPDAFVYFYAIVETGTGSGSGATSDANGRFTAYLHHDLPHYFEARCEGFVSTPIDGRTKHNPGSMDIEIVLKSEGAVTLLVLDKETSAPIEDLYTNVLRGNSMDLPEWRPLYRKYEGGLIHLNARAGIDAVEVAAPGFKRREVRVVTGINEVSLSRGPLLRGRLLSNGEPIGNPRITLELGTFQEWGWSSELGSRVHSTGEADGFFTVPLSAGGTYRLELRGSGPWPLLIAPIEVPTNGVLDLGDLELKDAAIVDAKVVLPFGVPLDGLKVYCNEVSSNPIAETDKAGKFRAELPSGRRSFRIEKKGLLAKHSEEIYWTELAAGETNSLVVPVNPSRVLCKVSVTVLSNDEPVSGLTVKVESDLESYGSAFLGRTDSDGIVTAQVPSMGPARLLVTEGYDVTFDPEAPLFTPQFGIEEELVINLKAGRLKLEWVSESPLRSMEIKSGVVDFINLVGVEITYEDSEQPVLSWRAQQATTLEKRDGVGFDSIELGPLRPGNYSIRVMVADEADSANSPNGFTWPPPFRAEYVGSAVVKAHQTTTCRLKN